MDNFSCFYKPDKKEYYNLGEGFERLNMESLSAFFTCPPKEKLVKILKKGKSIYLFDDWTDETFENLAQEIINWAGKDRLAYFSSYKEMYKIYGKKVKETGSRISKKEKILEKVKNFLSKFHKKEPSKLLEHALYEFKVTGFNVEAPYKKKFETDGDYNTACAKTAYEMLKVFVNARPSGYSAELTLAFFNRLAEWKALSPLTKNPEEWMEVTEQNGKKLYQSRRQPSCFSEDLKIFYDIDEIKDGKKVYRELLESKG